MKRFFTLSFISIILLPFNCYAVKVGGIFYEITNDEACVTYGESVYNTTRYTGDITIPDTISVGDDSYPVTSIGERAFSGCSEVTSISLPYPIKSIGQFAFNNCKALLELSLDPNPGLVIRTSAFSGCYGLRYVKIPDLAKWCDISFEALSSNPCYYGGALCIGSRTITNLDVPEGVTSIKNYAFAVCRSLTTASLSSTVTSIGDYAFYACTKLTEIGMPNSVTAIGAHTFDNCLALTENIVIPNSVTSIGEGAFNCCIAMKSLPTFPPSITKIEKYTFSNCSGLTSINIPEGIKTIEKSAFSDCTNLTSISVPESVTYLNAKAFSNCKNITNIEWKARSCADFTSDTSSDNYSDNLPFYDSRTKITSFTFGENVIRIPAHICSDLTSVVSITIPDAVKSIGTRAFNQSYIKDVHLGESVETIGSYAFYGCPYLTEIVIPNSVTTIGVSAFQGCSKLKSVALGTSVNNIDDYAFDACGSITEIDLPLSLTRIGKGGFCKTGLKSVYIPNSVKVLDDGVFSKCTGLAQIELGSSVEEIGQNAFYNTVITHISIPPTVKTIGFSPFPQSLKSVEWNAVKCAAMTGNVSGWFSSSGCTLEAITFGGSVEYIPAYICMSQAEIETIEFPASINSIGADAFRGCLGLKKITSHIIEPMTVSLGMTDAQYKQVPLYIPKGTTDAYLNALGWADFFNIIEMTGEVKGDLNGDGSVDGGDVSILLEMVLAGGLTDEQKAVADLNGDGDVDGGDVSILLEMVLSGE